jgi:hypothetical protein
MKARAICFALVLGVVSMTSGCHCFRCVFPNVGWRFHQGWCNQGCPPCAPACPIAYRPPVVVQGGPDCPCPPAMGVPNGYPPIAYPPQIGDPKPLPGGQLPAPMPDKKKDGNGY